MNALSVNSVSNIYLQTSVAQQKVAVDRANVIKSETQLSQDQSQLDKDLTYLASLQRKTQTIQQAEGSQAQSAAFERISTEAQSAELASSQAAVALAAATSAGQSIGSNVNVTA
ncbi:MAG: hypothetical protein WC742_00445 [Gallionellaceae bacterium]|jgi:hypothetical protein